MKHESRLRWRRISPSPPSRGRELKRAYQQQAQRNGMQSPPSRGRELKPVVREICPVRMPSPPSRGRELKQERSAEHHRKKGRPPRGGVS